MLARMKDNVLESMLKRYWDSRVIMRQIARASTLCHHNQSRCVPALTCPRRANCRSLSQDSSLGVESADFPLLLRYLSSSAHASSPRPGRWRERGTRATTYSTSMEQCCGT
jgi:hypothetical protein